MSTQVQFKDYSMGFKDDDGKVYNLIDHLNMQLDEGKALGIVGESGCGKSMTSLSLMRLLPAAASVQGGEILLNGEDLLKKSEPEMEKIRGKQIAMIFQEPMTALNPVMTIGKQIGECLKLHHPEMKEDEIRKQVCEALNDVGIANPETRIDQYPHEFSGGMRQRVMIAMAIINHPAILIADEPTTALDVTIQAQILDIMRRLKGSSGSLMLITHNLGIVAEICEEVVVMYAGRAIERGTLKAIFDNPLHPYTQGLMASVPTMRSEKKPLYTMVRYLLKRLGRGILTILLSVTLVFFIVRAMPSNPVDLMVSPQMSEEAQQALIEEFGLDQSKLTQYGLYMKELLHGNLGSSFAKRIPVSQYIAEKLPWTLLLLAAVMLIVILVGISVGLYAAAHKGKISDRVISVLVTMGISVFIPFIRLRAGQ